MVVQRAVLARKVQSEVARGLLQWERSFDEVVSSPSVEIEVVRYESSELDAADGKSEGKSHFSSTKIEPRFVPW